MKTEIENIFEKWSTKYKRSINCSRPKGFSQKAHCAGKKKRKNMYKEIEESNYIMDMMKEDVFGHRVTQYSPKDTIRLKNKLSQPTTDAEKEMFVAMVEPLMKRKSYISPDKDAFLDSFVDLDTRVGQHDFISHDEEDDELDYLFGGMDDIIDEE
jgi:hypothetical protein